MSDRLVDQIAEALAPHHAAIDYGPRWCWGCGELDVEHDRHLADVALGVVRDAVKALDLPWCGHCGSTQAVLALLDGGAS